MPRLRISTTTEFYEAVRGEAEEAPLLRGEVPTASVYSQTQYSH